MIFMREKLIAFIESVRDAVSGDPDGFRHSFSLQLNCAHPILWFGYGYFSREKVLVWIDESKPNEVSIEEAVDMLLGKVAPKQEC